MKVHGLKTHKESGMACLEGQRQAGQASNTLGPYFISQVSVGLKVLLWTDDWSFPFGCSVGGGVEDGSTYLPVSY